MENKDITMIPFVQHESDMNRMERVNKGLIKVVIGELIVILAMFVGIMIYFYLPSEIIEETDTQNVSDITNSDIDQNIGG